MVNNPTSHRVFLSSELEIAVVESLSGMILIDHPVNIRTLIYASLNSVI